MGHYGKGNAALVHLFSFMNFNLLNNKGPISVMVFMTYFCSL